MIACAGVSNPPPLLEDWGNMRCISSPSAQNGSVVSWQDAAIQSEEQSRVCDAPHVRYAGGNSPVGTCLGSGSYGTVRVR